MSAKSKSVNCEALHQAIDANLFIGSRRVTGEPDISHTSMGRHVHDVDKRIRSCKIVPRVTKILQNLWVSHLYGRKKQTDFFSVIVRVL